MTDTHDRQPSRPTPQFGAPDIGLDWAWNWGDTTQQAAEERLATAQARLLLLGEAPEAQRQPLIQAIHDAQHALDKLTGH